MKLGQTLKNIWEAVVYRPGYPHPEVKKALEDKGYKFVDETEYSALPYGGYLAPMAAIFNAEGQRVRYYEDGDPASEAFRKDYDQAIAERRAPKPGL